MKRCVLTLSWAGNTAQQQNIGIDVLKMCSIPAPCNGGGHTSNRNCNSNNSEPNTEIK